MVFRSFARRLECQAEPSGLKFLENGFVKLEISQNKNKSKASPDEHKKTPSSSPSLIEIKNPHSAHRHHYSKKEADELKKENTKNDDLAEAAEKEPESESDSPLQTPLQTPKLEDKFSLKNVMNIIQVTDEFKKKLNANGGSEIFLRVSRDLLEQSTEKEIDEEKEK